MTNRLSVLLLGAVIVIGAAMIATGPRGPATPRARAGASTPATAGPSSARRPRARATDPVVTVARAYALAARAWTARTYLAAWRKQLGLTTGRYRHRLQAARPTLAQLAGLRVDAAASAATVLRIERDPCVHASRARVVVWLSERTRAAGQTITGTTRNQVLLRRAPDGRWRVTGWTALPGPEATR